MQKCSITDDDLPELDNEVRVDFIVVVLLNALIVFHVSALSCSYQLAQEVSFVLSAWYFLFYFRRFC